MRLFLIGCTGFVGRQLVPNLLKAGHELTLISRKKLKNIDSQVKEQNQVTLLQLDPSNPKSWETTPILKALSEAEGIINFAGEPIAEKRWTSEHCQKLTNSRIQTTKSLVKSIAQLRKPPRVLINASAVGYYGTSKNSEFSEESPPGSDFLSKLCTQWEYEANQKPQGTRLVLLRLGIILGSDGGALGKMIPVFKAGFGGPIGNGKQWMSWIHREDLCEIINQSLTDNRWRGVINCVTPSPVTMKDFTHVLGKIMNRPTLITVPGTILKLLLGDGARVVLDGQKVKPNNLERLGFKYKYRQIDDALKETRETRAIRQAKLIRFT